MSAAPANDPAPRHLRVVGDVTIDADSGEIVPHPEVERLRIDYRMARRDVAAKNRRIAELERDHAAERLDYPRRADVEKIARYWHRKCRAKDAARSRPRIDPMSPDRFDAVRGLLDMERIEVVDGHRRRVAHYELLDFKRAIDGAFFDCFEKTRKNGTVVRYDDLSLICRSAAKFDEFVARAP